MLNLVSFFQVLGVCWPPATLVIAVSDIFDAFSLLVEFLTGSIIDQIGVILNAAIDPLLSLFNHPLVDAIREALQLLTSVDEVILDFLCARFTICFPSFPDLDINIPLDNLLNLVPDFETPFTELWGIVKDLPSAILNKVTPAWVTCGASSDNPDDLFSCMWPHLGIDLSPPSILDASALIDWTEELMSLEFDTADIM